MSEVITHQTEMPIALVRGEPITVLPQDLYIPPDALEIFLETFSGPLDLLLYLIKKQNVDILEIPVAEITHQYMRYVELMKAIKLELAAEYLVMAAMLAQIKSRMLLPRSPFEDEDEEDPRAELIRRLQEYERFKQAAEDLDQLPRRERDIFPVSAVAPDMEVTQTLPDINLEELLKAFGDVLKRSKLNATHLITREPLSVRERMTRILSSLQEQAFVNFNSFFTQEEGRRGLVVSFIAILELVKQALIEIVQTEAFSEIHLKPKTTTLEKEELVAEMAEVDDWD